MTRALAIALVTISACFAQQQYRFVSLTGGAFYRYANATRLSDSGSAIGRVQSNGQAVVFSPELGVIAPPFVEEINGINAAGDIVGTTTSGQPFVSRPPYNTLLDLGVVFGWIEGSAVAINDRGDVVGSGVYAPIGGSGYAQLYTFENWFPGLNVGYVMAINNRGQAIGVSSNPTNPQYFLYSPGTGVSILPVPPHLLNNNGDMLFGFTAPQYIQTASGQIPLPSGYTWVSINDSDQAVGYATATSPGNITTITSVYFSVATGLVDLSTRVVNPEAYIQFVPAAINNRGQIAVNYTWLGNPNFPPYQGVGLLEPTGELSGQRSVLRLPRASSPRTYGLNGVHVQTVK